MISGGNLLIKLRWQLATFQLFRWGQLTEDSLSLSLLLLIFHIGDKLWILVSSRHILRYYMEGKLEHSSASQK